MPPISRSRMWLAGCVYVAASMLPTLRESLSGPGPVNWPVVLTDMAIAAAPPLLAYIDGSYQTHKVQKAAGVPGAGGDPLQAPDSTADSSSNSSAPPANDPAVKDAASSP